MLRLELLRSDVVCVELRLDGDVELDLLLALASCNGESNGFPPLVPTDKSSILAQFDFCGMRDKISS